MRINLRGGAWIALMIGLCLVIAPAAMAQAEDGAASPTTFASVEEAAGAVVDPTASTERVQAAVRILRVDALTAARDELLDAYQLALATGDSPGDVAARLEVVLDSLESKAGADSQKETRDYLAAVAGAEPSDDLTDLTVWQTWLEDGRDWIVSPDGGIRIALAIVKFFVILLIARIIANIVKRILKKALERVGQGSSLLRDFLANIAGQIIFFVGLVIAIKQLGVDTTPLIAALGATGFVLGFALQGTLGNFAAGVMILLYRPFDIGDFVKVAGEAGSVKAMTLVSTTLGTPDNQTIVVPNGSIWGNTITNVTGNDTRRVDLVFGCSYDDDVQKVEDILMDVIKNHELVLADPAPVVAMASHGDSSVNFNVRPWCKTGDYWTVYSAIHKEVKQRFDAEGISIPYPHQEVYMHQVAAD